MTAPSARDERAHKGVKAVDATLSVWQVVELARHPNRPYSCLLYTSPSPRD